MINLVFSETKRSFYYLKEILKNKIKINKIIFYSNNQGSTYNLIRKTRLKKNLIHIRTNNINSQLILKKTNIKNNDVNIVSTYSGEIIKNENLLKLNLIHCHPGDLPKFKGSTTIYYSLILNKNVCVSVFVMNKRIDEGKILYKKFFGKPKKISEIENNFDHQIRAKTLVEYLKKKKSKKKYKTIKNNMHYYIAHPLIRQLVLNKNYLKKFLNSKT